MSKRVHRYTIESISAATGVSVHTVRQDARKGLLKPDDLAAVSEYVAWRRSGERLRAVEKPEEVW